MTEAVRQYGSARDRNIARAARLKALQNSWVTGSELTAAELAEIQPRLKQQFLEREARRTS